MLPAALVPRLEPRRDTDLRAFLSQGEGGAEAKPGDDFAECTFLGAHKLALALLQSSHAVRTRRGVNGLLPIKLRVQLQACLAVAHLLPSLRRPPRPALASVGACRRRQSGGVWGAVAPPDPTPAGAQRLRQMN